MSIKPLWELQKTAILEAILETGNISKAAKALGITRSTVYKILKRNGIKLYASEICKEARRQTSLQL